MARVFDPFGELDRWFTESGRTPTGVAMPMDLYREGDEFVARIDLPASTRPRSTSTLTTAR